MKHYINKQSPKQNDIKEDEEIIFPPDIDISVYDHKGINGVNYKPQVCAPVEYGEGIGGALSQKGGFDKQIKEDAKNDGYIESCSYLSTTGNRYLFPHNMSGRFDLISVPHTDIEPSVVSSMINLLDKYKHKYVCLDLWNAENIRIEKCGYLEDAEAGYILIRSSNSDELTMIKLSTIKYINIYCR